MADAAVIALLLLAALVAGAAAAWLLARRAGGTVAAERDAARADAESWREKFNRAVVDLAAASATAEAREAAHQVQLRQLAEAEEALAARFGDVGARILGEAQKQFLDRADQRFSQAGEASELKLKALLTPVEATLKRYDEKLGEIERARVGSYGELRQAVAALAQGNDVVRREAARLADTMRASPKARGRWGEEQLKNILVSAGLAENIDFDLQATVSDGERQLRPDCIVNLPNDRCIVIDVKNVWSAFEQAFDEEDEARRTTLLKSHVDAMRTTAGELGRKGYWKQFERSPEFVIMFVPGEHVLSAAAERAPDLIETAYRGGVVIASTINMLALAKVMAGMWRQEGLAREAREIADVGKELYKRLATMSGHVEKLGKNLAQATGAYNSFVGSLESQVLTQARRFETLKVDTGGKAIEPMPLVEAAVRPLTKLAAPAAEEMPAGAAE